MFWGFHCGGTGGLLGASLFYEVRVTHLVGHEARDGSTEGVATFVIEVFPLGMFCLEAVAEGFTDTLTAFLGEGVADLIGRDVIGGYILSLTYEVLLDSIQVTGVAVTLSGGDESAESGGVTLILVTSIWLYVYAIDADGYEDAGDLRTTIGDGDVKETGTYKDA